MQINMSCVVINRKVMECDTKCLCSQCISTVLLRQLSTMGDLFDLMVVFRSSNVVYQNRMITKLCWSDTQLCFALKYR